MKEVHGTTTTTTNALQGVQTASNNVPAIMPRVVIVGAGFGGLRVWRGLRRPPVHVTFIDLQNHHLFNPLLYWVATAGLSPADISSPIRHILRKQKNTEVLMAEVTGVDLQEQRVLMGDRSLPYDYLVLATGAHENYFGHPEWRVGIPSPEERINRKAPSHKDVLSLFIHRR